jgi:hypothetical protein
LAAEEETTAARGILICPFFAPFQLELRWLFQFQSAF